MSELPDDELPGTGLELDELPLGLVLLPANAVTISVKTMSFMMYIR